MSSADNKTVESLDLVLDLDLNLLSLWEEGEWNVLCTGIFETALWEDMCLCGCWTGKKSTHLLVSGCPASIPLN